MHADFMFHSGLLAQWSELFLAVWDLWINSHAGFFLSDSESDRERWGYVSELKLIACRLKEWAVTQPWFVTLTLCWYQTQPQFSWSHRAEQGSGQTERARVCVQTQWNLMKHDTADYSPITLYFPASVCTVVYCSDHTQTHTSESESEETDEESEPVRGLKSD